MANQIPGTNLYRTIRRKLGNGNGSHLLVRSQVEGPFAECFRLVALSVDSMLKRNENGGRGLAVLSAYPGDGRSLIAANLAWALAAYGRVMVFDGDRQADYPIGEVMGIQAEPSVKLPRGVRAAYTLNGHQDAGQDAILCSSADLADVVALASASGVTCVLDTPPAVVLSAAFELAQKAGNAVYIIRDRVQDMEVHREVRKTLERLDVNLLGIIQNEY